MIELDAEQQAARDWFESLRDRICAEFEAIEREAGGDARFDFAPWDRNDIDGSPGGGGVRGLMKGRVFEKVGVNVSTVGGSFSPEFAQSIHGAAEDPRFFATGISLVAHMANPHAPAVHMNTRFLTTTKRWFGGGADLNPPIPYEEDTADFHARPPGERQRLREQPAAMALPRQLRHQAEKADQAFAVDAEIELEQPGFPPGFVEDGMDLRDLRHQRRVVHRQPREPEPSFADAAEQRPIALGVDRSPALEPQRRRRDRPRHRPLAHLQIGHHRRDVAARHVDQRSAHRILPRAVVMQPSVTTRSPAAAGSSGWRRHCRRSSARTGYRGRRSG